ncbi:DsrE family protein [Niabella beijingensis]|uniref:DsrE family protein n=1 Tax=Niabella beijingensis TaxID=2872700 RepID=UPI001CBB6E79|nr:DsrE family protein [Niabella beijingensis]MBZ4187826.1 DsrE family protein [Niabella beijingensis]
MKQILLIGCSLLVTLMVNAQQLTKAEEKNRAFTGAVATQKQYRVIYQMDSGDPKIIEKVLRNLNNALNDPRLKGKLQAELVAFSGGTDAYLKGSKYEATLKALVEKGVIIAQCANTLHERKIGRDAIYDFIGLVPSGNGELILRQTEGWPVIKP